MTGFSLARSARRRGKPIHLLSSELQDYACNPVFRFRDRSVTEAAQSSPRAGCRERDFVQGFTKTACWILNDTKREEKIEVLNFRSYGRLRTSARAAFREPAVTH